MASRVGVPCAGIVYGLYLTLSSWVLFHVATGMTFFADKCHLADLNTTPQVLSAYCQSVSPLGQHLYLMIRHPTSGIGQRCLCMSAALLPRPPIQFPHQPRMTDSAVACTFHAVPVWNLIGNSRLLRLALCTLLCHATTYGSGLDSKGSQVRRRCVLSCLARRILLPHEPSSRQRLGGCGCASCCHMGQVPGSEQGAVAAQAFQATKAPLSSIPIYAGQMAGKDANVQSITVMDQCMAEQRYVRDSITRSLIYNHVCFLMHDRARVPPGRKTSFGVLEMQRQALPA